MEEKKSLRDYITYSGSRMSLDGVDCWLERYPKESKYSISLGKCEVEFVRSSGPVLHVSLENLDKEFLAKFFLEEAELIILAGEEMFREPVYVGALSKGRPTKILILLEWRNYDIKNKFNTNKLLTKLNEYNKE